MCVVWLPSHEWALTAGRRKVHHQAHLALELVKLDCLHLGPIKPCVSLLNHEGQVYHTCKSSTGGVSSELTAGSTNTRERFQSLT